MEIKLKKRHEDWKWERTNMTGQMKIAQHTHKKIKHITDPYEGLGYSAPLQMCTVYSICNNCVLYVKKKTGLVF